MDSEEDDVLHEYAHLSAEEAAVELGLSVSYVRRRRQVVAKREREAAEK